MRLKSKTQSTFFHVDHSDTVEVLCNGSLPAPNWRTMLPGSKGIIVRHATNGIIVQKPGKAMQSAKKQSAMKCDWTHSPIDQE